MEGYGNDDVTLNPTQIFSVLNWALKKNQPEGPHFTTHILAICNAAEPVAFKAPKTSSKDEKATKGGSSSKETTGSPTGHSKKKKSGTAKDLNPSQPSASTPVVAGMHKEALQANNGLISLGVTSEVRVDPQLITDSTTEANPGKSALNDSLSKQQDKTKSARDSSDDSTKKIKLDDLSKLVKDVKTLNLKLLKENEEAKTVVALLKAQQSFPNVEKLTELLELKKYVHELEIELPGDLKEILTKLEEFTSTVCWGSASHKAGDQNDTKANLNKQPIPTTTTTTIVIPPIILTTVQLQSPFLSSPISPKTTSQPEGELVKNKGKEAMTHEETEEKEYETDYDAEAKLSGSMGDHVHLISEEIKEQKWIEESVKADMAKKEEELKKEESFDLLGIDLVTNVYKAKIKYDKYCDKMLNRRALARIINCDILSKGKGPITLKVYKENGSNEIIPNFKASDLYQAEWREVMQVCSKRTRAGCHTPKIGLQRKGNIGVRLQGIRHMSQKTTSK
ncbi:hypothetical protein Tco_1037829 [Tanacetum coccineum]